MAFVNDAPSFTPPGPGSVTTDIASNSNDVAQSITLQADGKILVAGATGIDPSNFALTRYNADGSLDTSFNATGIVVTDIGGVSSDVEIGWSVVVQPDGKIVMVGTSGPDHNFAIVRYNANGSLDTSFNGTGKVVIDLGPGNSRDLAHSVALQSDGKIVVCGTSFEGGSQDFAVMRLNANGSLDTTFNGTGKALTDFTGDSTDFGNSVVIQSNGKIIVAGASYAGSGDALPSGNPFDIALARYNSDGTPDLTFNGTGTILTSIGSNDSAQSVALQADGKILVGGYSDGDFVVARYNIDGSLDFTFNGTGVQLVDLDAGSYDEAYSIKVQSDGKIVVAGTSVDQIAVVRLNSDGSLDTNFNGTGAVLTDLGANTFGDAVSVQSDGKIVVAGMVQNTSFDFAVVRYDADGSLDTTFGATASSTLGGTFAYTEDAAPVALDNSVAIFDAELGALDGGAGNYAGASISLSRHLVANIQDVFSTLNNLSLDAGNAVLSGVTIGSYTNTNGKLSIIFNSNATQARVDEALSSIAYSNTSNAPPTQVRIDWTFNDGNTGSQGTGGALSATGSTLVNITGVNDAPTLVAGLQSQTLVEAGGVANGSAGTASASIAMTQADVDSVVKWDATAFAAAGWSSDGGTFYTKAGTYGTATLRTATGVITYALNNTATATQALTEGQLVADNFTIFVTDGSLSANASASFTVTGANDAPTATAGPQSRQLFAAGGTGAGVNTATITITKADVDSAATWNAAALLAGGWSTSNGGTTYVHQGTYGTATLTTATGIVAYLLDDARAATMSLLTGDSVTDAFTVNVTDGAFAAAATATFGISGASTAPRLTVGSQQGQLIEAGGSGNDVAGKAHATIAVALETVEVTGAWDVAGLLAHGWTAGPAAGQFSHSGLYGLAVFTTATGVISYTLDDASNATEALQDVETATDSFTVYATNGAETSSAAAQFEITGANDAPVFTSFSGAAATTIGAAEVRMTFADLLALSDASDVDGIVESFVVTAVDSGTLRIGSSAATATAWAQGTNDVISGSAKAFWTPASNSDGAVAAFEVVAADDLQAQSAAALSVQVVVGSKGGTTTGGGTSHADVLTGTSGGDLILALDGNDTINGGGGSDTIDGGGGIDTIIVSSKAELDQAVLTGVERVQLSFSLMAIDTDAPTSTSDAGNTWQAAALYRAAFGALPNIENLSHWTSVSDESADMGELAQSMIDYYAPGISSTDLVAYLYKTLVGVYATMEQVQYFVDKIGPGKPFETQGDLFAAAAIDPINTNHMLEFAGSMPTLDPTWF